MFTGGGRIEAHDARTLFVIYGSGYAAVFGTFALLYVHAWRKRDALALNDVERLRTLRGLIDHIAMVVIGLTSALLALSLPANLVGLAGWFYFSVGIYFMAAGSIFGRRERSLLAKKRQASASA